MKRLLALISVGALLATMAVAGTAEASRRLGTGAPGLSSKAHPEGALHFCNTNGINCTEPSQNWEEFPWFKKASHQAPISEYIGHDEPSVLYYSNRHGSGNSNEYRIRLPKQPLTRPRNDGSGGTYDFQLHPAFWLGMAMCDNQSAPNPGIPAGPNHTRRCRPDSNHNIFESTDPASPRYMDLHPGTAFMEMQFYPPGWVKWPPGISCTAHKWCAALNVDSLSINYNTGALNNADCLNRAGVEPVNFAFITKNGHATSPANPLSPGRFTPRKKKDFLMRSGDMLKVNMFDTRGGFTVVIHDLTTQTSGRMKASVRNGFGKVKFDPNASTCSVIHTPFHPEYSTSTPRTRVPWAAHSYNVAYSDEIGHFEYCKAVNFSDLSCAVPSGDDTHNRDIDDVFCLPGALSTLIHINGCLGSDGDFDGVSYQHTWPGSMSNRRANHALTPQPIKFSSPTFRHGHNYKRVAFETDLPRIEDPDSAFDVPTCQRHISNPADPHPGRHCVNPPPGSNFYPFYTTTRLHGSCIWQEGGKYLRATHRFGGEKREFGHLLVTRYAATGYSITKRYNNFRRIVDHNPCKNRF
jgi:hypothetical protein